MSTSKDIRLSSPEDIRETVRERYAEAATRSAAADHDQALAVETSCCAPVATTGAQASGVETSCCAPAQVTTTDAQGREVFGGELYGPRVTTSSWPSPRSG